MESWRSQLATTEQRMTEISGRRAYIIRAPATGHVSTLQATVGQFADSRRPQMEIVPNDSILQAELFVPARAIGFVRPGQKVRGVPVSAVRHIWRPSLRGLADHTNQVG
jgi:membrane fusion protein